MEREVGEASPLSLSLVPSLLSSFLVCFWVYLALAVNLEDVLDGLIFEGESSALAIVICFFILAVAESPIPSS